MNGLHLMILRLRVLLAQRGSEGVSLQRLCPALSDAIDLELEKALLGVSVLPVIVTPLVVPVVRSLEVPSSYLEPPLPGRSDATLDPVARISPLREVADSPILDVFPSYLASPAGFVYEPVTSSITSSLREDDGRCR